MNLPRLLYVDVPFEHESGGDKNSSRFLWHTLSGAFDTDLLLIAPSQSVTGRPLFTDFKPVLRLPPVRGPWHQSDSVFAFGPLELDAFRELLTDRRYDAVFTRFHSPWALALAASAHATRPAVIVDLDMVSSRLVGLTWRQAPSFKNRWFLFEKLKLARLEKQLVRQPFLVLFSNPVELADIRGRVAPTPSPARLAVLPNVMPPPPKPGPVTPQPAILFFGSMNSGANTDAFRYLVESLLPLLDADLRRHDVKLHIVGKNPPPWFAELLEKSMSDRVLLVGGVDSMERAIAESRFVFLPLRVASGTRTRILEAAALGKAVVTTTIGAEGIEVGEDALIADTPTALATAVRQLLDNPAQAETLGRRLREHCVARYSEPRVAGDLVREVSDFIASRSANPHFPAHRNGHRLFQRPSPHPHLQISHCGSDVALGSFRDLADDRDRSVPAPGEEGRDGPVFRWLEADRLKAGLEAFR
jgi:glycosyltransferase involved in cell wall biosynthesis